MLKKLWQSKVLQNWHLWGQQPSRFPNDIYLLHKTCEYFCPKQVLEVGFHLGQTFGNLIEACDNDTKFVSVEIDYGKRRQVFDSVFATYNNVTWLEQDSRTLDLQTQFDFVFIDGDHTYEYVNQDIQNALPLLTTNSILCVDDYPEPGVDQAIRQHLLGQNGWVPVIKGHQEMFFFHHSRTLYDFLYVWLQDRARNFINFNHEDYHGYRVVSPDMPNVFRENIDIFLQTLKFYDL